MKILIVTGKFHGSGGTETFVSNISQGFIKRGHTVTIVSHQKFFERKRGLRGGKFNVYYTFPSFHIPRIPMSYMPFYVLAKCLRLSMIAKQRYDIVNAQGELEGFCTLQVKSLLNCPITVRVAGIWHSIGVKEMLRVYGNNRLTSGISWVIKLMEKEALEKSDAISILNEQQKEILVKEYNVSPRKVRVIPHGVNTDVLSPKMISRYRDAMRTFYHLEGPVILYVGRLTPIKRIDLLVEALGLLVRDIPPLKLVLIGPRSYKDIDYYMTQAGSLKVDKNLVYLGEVPHEKMVKYLAISDVYADVSEEYGLGFSTLEAMSCGLPVVATRAEEGVLKVNYDVQSIAEGIRSLLADEKKARTLGEKARKHIVKAHSLEKVVDEYIGFFEDTLNRKND
jgi:glycosyltransferase involved in cell wall biosynthesis